MQLQQRSPRVPLVSAGAIDHHVRDMTATFSAELTLQAVQELLGRHDQWLPIDGRGDETIGQLVERNSTGPLRLGYGAWRDLLLGCQFRNGRGELITAGGRTVKNVAGYDLTKFMVGQHGMFGSVVTITTRTYRLPQAALLAIFEPDVKRLKALMTTPARPQWCVLKRDGLLCGYLGDEAALAFYETELPGHAPQAVQRQTIEQDMTLRSTLWSTSSSFRASVPPMNIEAFVTEARIPFWSADAAFGIVVGVIGESEFDGVTQAAKNAGGSVVLYDSNAKPLTIGVANSIRPLLQRLKLAFDTEAALAPLPEEAR